MIAPMFVLGFLGLALAGPEPSLGELPVLTSSKGFKLAIDLLDSFDDFATPVQNSYLTSIHIGAGLAMVGISPDSGRVFYQNGTIVELSTGQSTTITDGGTPTFPSGLTLQTARGQDSVPCAHLDAGLGTPGISLAPWGVPYLLPEYFLVCSEPLSYYQGAYFHIVRHTTSLKDVPIQCRAARLVAWCAELADLPPDAISSHEYVLDSPCYV